LYFSFCEIRPLFVIAAGPGGQRSWLISLRSLPLCLVPPSPQPSCNAMSRARHKNHTTSSPIISLSSDNIELRQDLFTLDTPVQNLLQHRLKLPPSPPSPSKQNKKYKKKMCCFLPVFPPTLLYLPSIANRLSLWSR
jgi:hypothetical protein